MYGKFINTLPYYRQEKDFENQFGVKIGRGTMAHWTIYCAQNYFSPMSSYFHRQLVKRKYVAADETPIQVLKEADRRPQSKSYVWLFRSGDDGLNLIIIYQYHPTRNGDAAAKFFHGSAPGTTVSRIRNLSLRLSWSGFWRGSRNMAPWNPIVQGCCINKS